MAWQTPKKNWKAGDSPSSDDFNRIEENTDELNNIKVKGPLSAEDGHVALFDGITGKLIKDGGPPHVEMDYQEFLSSGTWTKPDNISMVLVDIIGAGGGGSAGNSNGLTSGGGSGGGGGGRIIRFIPAHLLPASVAVTVGAGGTGGQGQKGSYGNGGGDGGDTKFGTFAAVEGGEGAYKSYDDGLVEGGVGGSGSIFDGHDSVEIRAMFSHILRKIEAQRQYMGNSLGLAGGDAGKIDFDSSAEKFDLRHGGGNAEYGGAGGGPGCCVGPGPNSFTFGTYAEPGGGSLFGAGGGAGGGANSCDGEETNASFNWGEDGGRSGKYFKGGGPSGGSVNRGDGQDGSNAGSNLCGDGGGGGAGSYTSGNGGKGGKGGFPGGGGGGGGAGYSNLYTGGAGGNGANGVARIWAW